MRKNRAHVVRRAEPISGRCFGVDKHLDSKQTRREDLSGVRTALSDNSDRVRILSDDLGTTNARDDDFEVVDDSLGADVSEDESAIHAQRVVVEAVGGRVFRQFDRILLVTANACSCEVVRT